MAGMTSNAILTVMREYFAVITSGARDVTCEALAADFQQKRISPHTAFRVHKDETLRSLGRRLARLFYPFRYSVLFGLNSTEAVTIYDTVVFLREHPEQAMASGELDSVISKTIWQVFEQGRIKASRQLAVHDVDLLLRDVRILGVAVNGKPWGEGGEKSGRRVSVSVLLTFMRRSFEVECVRAVPRRAAIRFMAEKGSATAHFLGRGASKNNFLFATPADDHTDLFFVNDARAAYEDSFRWGYGHCVRALAQAYKIPTSVGEEMLQKLNLQDAAPSALRRFLKDTKSEIRQLVRGIEHARTRSHARNALLYAPRLCGFAKFPTMVQCVDRRDLLRYASFAERPFSTGLTALFPWKRGRSDDVSFFALALFLEWQSFPANILMNRFARRRMKWLLAG